MLDRATPQELPQCWLKGAEGTPISLLQMRLAGKRISLTGSRASVCGITRFKGKISLKFSRFNKGCGAGAVAH